MDSRPPEIDASELRELREDTPGVAHRIHLNNAGSAPPPRPVLEAIVSHLELEAAIGGYEAADQEVDTIRAAYAAVASLLDVEADQVAFVENATAGYAQILSCFAFEPGDVILTSREDYVSNQLMFLSLAERFGIRVERVESAEEGGLDLEHLARRLAASRPRLLALSHVPTNSGLVQPVKEAGALASAAEVPYLVDVCQSVGQRPLSLGELKADYLSATSRKFLRGPRGSGFLAVSRRVLESNTAPLFLDLQGARWTGVDTYELVPSAARFENWEFAYALVLGTGEAARYAQRIGLDRIARRTTALADQLRSALAGRGLRVLDRGRDRCGIVTVEIPEASPAPFLSALNAAGLNGTASLFEYGRLDFGAKDVDWALRLSPHYYNSEDEIDMAVEIVVEAARE